MLQHPASPDFVCVPVISTAFVLVLADLSILVSGAFGVGIFPKIKRTWVRIALFFLLILILPLVFVAVLLAGCGLV
jgi:hypothetical protein